MECNNVREELVAYIDNELPSVDKRAIEAHLANCKECAAEYDKLTETIESTHEVGDIQPAQNWWERLQKRLYALGSDRVSTVIADPTIQVSPDATEDFEPDTSKMLCKQRCLDRGQITDIRLAKQ